MAETSGIIEIYARHLEQKASRVVTRLTTLFGLVGALLGGFPLIHVANPLVPGHLGYATLLLGALAGAYLGYSMGERRAVEPRLQAQLALRQFEVEQSLIRRVTAQQPAPPVAPPAAVAPPVVEAPVLQPIAPAPIAPAPVTPQPAAPPPVVAPAPVSPPPVTPAAVVAAPPLSSTGS